jgi:peptidoglycan hydrolase FlgJ
MQITKPALLPLNRQEAPADTAKINDVSRKLESQFTNMLVKCMRDASFGDSMFPQENQTYRDLYDRQLSDMLSKGKGLGLQSMIARQLNGGQAPGDASAPKTDGLINPMPSKKAMAFYQRFPGGSASADALDAVAGRSPSDRVHDASAPPSELMPPQVTDSDACDEVENVAKVDPSQFRSGSPEHFVASIWPHAQRAARELGVDPRALVAQVALETGWGRRGIRGGDGTNANNLFGIKATGWSGKKVSTTTHEFVDGERRSERADFRVYSSPADSFNDYVRLLKTNTRYQQALTAGTNIRNFAQGLQRAGYATDPAYASKITAIAGGPTIGRAMAAIGVAANSIVDGAEKALAGAAAASSIIRR